MKSDKSDITKATYLLILLLFLSPFLTHHTAATTNDEVFSFPAEFERHEFVWITWTAEADLSGKPTDKVVLQIIKELSPFVKIKLVVESNEQLAMVKKILRKPEIKEGQIDYVIVPRNDRWMRDMGPIFLKGNKASLKIVDFNYSFYGELPTSHPFSRQVERIDRLIANQLRLPTVKSDLVSEGGDREFNGKGTMMAVEAVELQRNPTKTKEEIEKELLRVLGQKKIIWLKKGPAEDDKSTRGPLPGNIYTATVTGGHIDEFCRFVDSNTVLLAEVSPEERDSSPISRISYERLEENYRILCDATDQDGKPFRIIRVPVANHIIAEYRTKKGDDNFGGARPGETVKYILAASYLNFLVTNGVVLVQSYWKEGRPESTRGKDEKAKRILQEAFPDRKIVQLNAEDVNHGGGGIHCITQQQPAVGRGLLTTRRLTMCSPGVAEADFSWFLSVFGGGPVKTALGGRWGTVETERTKRINGVLPHARRQTEQPPMKKLSYLNMIEAGRKRPPNIRFDRSGGKLTFQSPSNGLSGAMPRRPVNLGVRWLSLAKPS